MERWHGGKHIGTFAVEAGENACMYQLIEPLQAGSIARRVCIKGEPIVLHIPRWGSGIHVIPYKTYQVYKQESEGKLHELIVLLIFLRLV